MKTFLKILSIIVGIIAVLLIVAIFTRKEYTVEREVTINSPRQTVFDYVKYLKNQDHYNKWVKMDPSARKDFKGTDGTVGFVSVWASDKPEVGKGEQEIKEIKEGEKIDLELRFIEPFEGVVNTYMTTESVTENQTKVTWVFNGKMNYPMNIMLVFMNIEKSLGTDLETSLADLKSVLEK